MSGPGVRPRRALPASVRGLPAAFWWIWLSILVNWVGGFAGPVLALYLTNARGFSPTRTGLLVSLLGLGGLLGAYLGGRSADRFGRRRTMVAGHLWTAASMAALGLATTPWTLAVAGFSVGLGAVSVRPAMQAALADVVPLEDRQRAFALNYWALNVGMSVSAALAGVLVERGYATAFLSDAAATALCAGVIWVKVPETRPPTPARSAGPERPESSAGAEDRPDRYFVVFVLATLLFALVFQQASTTLPVVLAREGHRPETITLLAALNGVLVVLLQLPLTRLARSRNRGVVLLVAGVTLGLGFGLLGFAAGAAAFAGCVVLWTFGEMLQAPAGVGVVADRAPAHRRGRYQGWYGMAWSVAALLGPAGGGWLVDRGSADLLWGACAALATAAGLAYAWAVGPTRSFPRAADPADAGEGSGPPLPTAAPGPGSGTTRQSRILARRAP